MCPPQSLKIVNGKPQFKLDECIRCCCCQEHCPKGAIEFKTNIFLRGVEKFRSILSKLAR
jgi:Fe-S-cluster-containing hydrogenase component 2